MIKYIYKAIGNIFGENKDLEEFGDPLEFESGFFLDCAIFWVYVSIEFQTIALITKMFL